MSKLSISGYFVSEKVKGKEYKQGSYPDRKFRALPITVVVLLLCALSFYLGGVFCSDKHKLLERPVVVAPQTPKKVAVTSPQLKSVVFPECGIDHQDYTPCTDPKRWRKYSYNRLSFMERHCPPLFERKECLVPPPNGYKIPIRWPKSKDECWYRNVPYDWINNQKSNQNWLRKQGEKFLFPGGGTMFPKGVGHYVDLMQALIPGMKDKSIRTALDTGCGVASWGGDLLDRGILTMSLAPRDNHEAQVQFALERGIPAILGILSTQRLPFPSNSFDMAHCSRCLIPWTEFGGVYLLEIHRILRPGGFWVLSGPPVNYQNRWRGWNTTIEEQKADYNSLQTLLTKMCFKQYSKKDDIAVWQKSTDNSCYDKLAKADSYPPKCDDSFEPDAAWYVPLRPCVVAPDPNLKKTSLKSLPKWPERLHAAPERVSIIHGGSAGAFNHDDSKWKVRVKHYKTLLPALGTDKIRNVMDMNTVYGGFAAALIDSPLWVMNVVSSYSINTLSVVFDRGLIGTNHDWCEAFSTYPRTYDLLHLDGLFTAESHRCEMKYVLLEMDRILRPDGYVIMRESSHFVEAIQNVAKGMKWSCQKHDTEYSVEQEKVLICQKKLWYSSGKKTTE
ncbi:probable methyltransferase PMT20 [Nymphaea colorata]|nr:probable methyltransferase PMT20 [Nymphaea colorata]XP_031483087.1 probable methyltransferase PMT20 [Nymphaea colorata]XP_031483088.1 probable methyltransferase PMT20 [Nymphaea colorata]XP_031483089.1 probable methyltransferase PMT20 [Nymphaea colorata]XP_031483090.1 probable methyltransferase PMT20 [Nymphaea colorata]XP_031483091.1 probable methyltransferase PMT20 [Nymphaea colorata]